MINIVALVLAAALIAVALWATVLLVSDLIRGKGVADSPDQLLATRAVVWCPRLSFTDAAAFSPTDVLPPTHRSKYAMLLLSTVAIALFGLVVARAVNVLK